MLVACLASCVGNAQKISIIYSGSESEVSAPCPGVTVKKDGSRIEIESQLADQELIINMKGTSPEGSLMLKSQGKTTIRLEGLNLTSSNGAPIRLHNKKRVLIQAAKGTTNTLCVSACTDTANNKQAVIWAKGKLHLGGKGKLDVIAQGDGCKGINAKDDIKISDLTLNVITEGNNLGKDTTNHFGFGGGMPPFPPPFGDMPEGFKPPWGDNPPPFGEMPEGFMPPWGDNPPDFSKMPDFGAFGGFPGMGGFGESGDPDETQKGGFKQKYIATTKAIKSGGIVTINSGNIYCKTSAAGAEGIEGKKGVVINGGNVKVDAIDDAINANATISFNGGTVIAESHCNDAVDANIEGGFPAFGPMPQDTAKKDIDPGIIISGGEVYAFSHVGAPEEGIDCDYAPVIISGGTVFTIGAGMGELPSVPTEENAKQPTVVFTGLTLTKGETMEIISGNKVIFRKEIPFTFNNSASMFTCNKLKKGKTYTIRTKNGERQFSVNENFAVVRK